MKPMVLVVDDEPLQREIMKTILDGAGYETHTAGSGREALVLAAKFKPEVILTDLKMAGMDGIELLESLPATEVAPAVIIVTAHGTIASAVDALKRGALDYLTKPLDKDKVLFTVRKACERGEILKENVRLKKELFDRFSLEGIVGQSPRMTEIVNLLRKVSGASATVMLRGESGTGKELVARAIHFNGARRSGPFVAIHCGGLSETMLESELFGHVKGAFTGADRERDGKCSRAQGGTLFLDEIGDMPLSLQPKLLRLLEERVYEKVGSDRPATADFRIIVATHRNLDECCNQGAFRRDLYYRLNIFPITIPPLRERREDISQLSEHFLNSFRKHQGKLLPGLSRAALDLMLAHDWPGNVRELEHAIEHATVLCKSEIISAQDLPLDLLTAVKPVLKEDAFIESRQQTVKGTMTLEEALAMADGNKTRAASLLGISRRTIYRHLEE
ncbi:MAG TPA: hypothetical protein DEB35_04585 [Desulfuromonas sp.]|nr:hypothetical protein [Desulfuromonas sp.]